MTHLRKMMLEELQRRHYSEATTQRYIRFIERFAQHFHCSPGSLGPQHIREYQAQLFTVRKLTPGTVTNHLCALRFLYIQTLKRPWSIADTPYPKKRYRLPTVLSQEEVAQLIDAAPTPFYRTILMTLYGTGARRTELTRLKVSDVDRNRMCAALLPRCFAALHAVPPQVESEPSTAPTTQPLWRCPKCGGPMIVAERFTAAQLQLRSPPLLATTA